MTSIFKKHIAFSALALSAFCIGTAQAENYLTHANFAEKLISFVQPTNNVYDSNPTIVTWAGINGAAIYQNRSTCSPFVTRVIKTAYDISDTTYKNWFDSTSPSSSQYHAAIVAQNHFQRVMTVEGIQRGDLLSINYLPCANKDTTGHMMIAMSGAIKRTVDTAPIIAGTEQYDISIADSSSSSHQATDANGKIYKDTRGEGSGAGMGTLRLYKDKQTGQIAGYTWTVSSASVFYSINSCRVIAVGRLQ
ncbi:hypothetical protein [Undibacterium flavidum]|uniref:Uncharacterized protein n=1 Tax=Undibacterium flavidum TaxID=2762297 RepID=A0ABR6YF63_9BURK|nr:hypothetical protein [Undibacterium flavidum]MBC3875182.1 hypothetical protein [Undibacterium flavidum]